MNRTLLIATSMVTMMLYTGCAVKSGNIQLEKMNSTQVNDAIINGKTTKAEVKQLMQADPQSVDFDQNGHEKWVYANVRKDLKAVNYVPVVNWFVRGTNDTTKTLVIVFDNNGVVLNHAVTQAEGETKGGLFQ